VHALNAYEIGLHQKPYPKRCWLQQGKQSADGVVGGNAVSKRQKALQPGGFTVTVGFDFDPTACAADDLADGEGNDI
jgi:hypothetical protein